MKISEALAGVGAPIAYHSNLARCFKSVKAAILFSQIFYWQQHSASSIGVYKSAEDLELETALTYREQKAARDTLVRLGVLIETHRRLEHRIYFSIDLDRLDEVFFGWLSEHNHNSAKSNSVTPETTKDSFGGKQNLCSFIRTENTTEKEGKAPSGADVWINESKTTEQAKQSAKEKGFAEFWEVWPKSERKQAKGACLKAWVRVGACKDTKAIIAHIETCKDSDSWQKDGGQYIPAPLVYLNQKRWEGAEVEPEQKIMPGVINRYGAGFEGVL